MSAGVYVMHPDGRLVEMREQPYDSEDLLQKLLADYPNLLAGDQMFHHMNTAPFDELSERRKLLDLLNRVQGIHLSPDRASKRVSIKLAVLNKPEALQQFLAAFDWYLDEIKAAQENDPVRT